MCWAFALKIATHDTLPKIVPKVVKMEIFVKNLKLQFQLTGDVWRTPTFDWIRDELPPENTELSINSEKYITNDFVSTREVTGMLCYHRNENDHCENGEVCDVGDICEPVSFFLVNISYPK